LWTSSRTRARSLTGSQATVGASHAATVRSRRRLRSRSRRSAPPRTLHPAASRSATTHEGGSPSPRIEDSTLRGRSLRSASLRSRPHLGLPGSQVSVAGRWRNPMTSFTARPTSSSVRSTHFRRCKSEGGCASSRRTVISRKPIDVASSLCQRASPTSWGRTSHLVAPVRRG
jgi:hypothetical protein